MDVMQQLTQSVGQIVTEEVPSGVGIAVILAVLTAREWTTFTSNLDPALPSACFAMPQTSWNSTWMRR